MFCEGFMIAASAVIGLLVICPPFLRSTMVTWEGSTHTIQLSDDMVVKPCLIEVSGTPNAVSCVVLCFVVRLVEKICHCIKYSN